MTLPPAYFDEMYNADRDPWGFESRWYEKRKYSLTIASLLRERYRHGLEIGCSIGVLTAMLAAHCASLLAVDSADAAVVATRARLEGRPGVEVEQLFVPDEWPAGEFDLIVLSEVGYYFSPADLDRLLRAITASLAADGSFVAVHWRHPVADYPASGDAVHEAIAAMPGLHRAVHHVEADFRLDVFSRGEAGSVARVTGLLG